MMFAAVIFLTGSDANGEPIFFGRQRAGGEGGKGAGWIFSLVEIEHDFTVLGRCGGQKAASPIGFLASSQVSYYEKKFHPALVDWEQFEGATISGEHGFARNGGEGGLPNHVGDVDLMRWVERDPRRLKAPAGIQGEIIEPHKILEPISVTILDAQK